MDQRISDDEISTFLDFFDIRTPSNILVDSLKSMKPGALEQLTLEFKRYGRQRYNQGSQESGRGPA